MMRTTTGLALAAIGAILLLAVNVRLGFVSLKLTGLILMATGLAGLRGPQLAYRWLHGHQDELTRAVGRLTGTLDRPAEALRRFMELPLPPSPRVPLDDLLQAEVPARAPASRRD